jgi:ComF family protein
MNAVKTIFDFTLDIFFPRRCVACGKYGLFLCHGCASEIEYMKTPVCLKCGKITHQGEFCLRCRRDYVINGILYSTAYDNKIMQDLLHNFKYNRIVELGEILGEIITNRIRNLRFDNTVVVPVPLHSRREAERGYNQSEILARKISSNLGFSGGNALNRVKNTQTQVGLRKEERIKNMQDAFCCSDIELIDKKVVLLIDDVVTTGATLNECAKVLKAAGAKKVIGLTVAKRN